MHRIGDFSLMYLSLFSGESFPTTLTAGIREK